MLAFIYFLRFFFSLLCDVTFLYECVVIISNNMFSDIVEVLCGQLCWSFGSIYKASLFTADNVRTNSMYNNLRANFWKILQELLFVSCFLDSLFS